MLSAAANVVAVIRRACPGSTQDNAAGTKALIPQLQACTELNSLDLQDNDLDTDAINIIAPSLSQLKALGDLRVANNGIGAKDGGAGARALIPVLKSLPKLHTLYFTQYEKDAVPDDIRAAIQDAVPEGCVVHY